MDDSTLIERAPEPVNRYRVVGRNTVDGVATGGIVTIGDPRRARQLRHAGAIAPLPTPADNDESESVESATKAPTKKAPAKKTAAKEA